MKRIRTLDGIRGIAILQVVTGHALSSYGPMDPAVRRWLLVFANPQTGVRLFFVLSGYLITKILLEERERTGSISLRHFYLRRSLRIFPAYYFYLLVLAAATLWIGPSIGRKCWLAAVTFSWNYAYLWIKPAPWRVWSLGHTWTLAMEQQFYLLWPPFLVRFFGRGLGWGVGALIVSVPLVRVGSYFLFPGQRGALTAMFHTGCDSIMIGCAAALWFRLPQRRPMLRYSTVAGGAAVWLALVSPLTGEILRGFPIVFGYTLDAFAAAWIIAWLDHTKTHLAVRALGSWPLVLLGTLSYSLYLWQQPFLSRSGGLARGHWLAPLMWACAAAAFSFFAIERPFLRYRVRPAGPPDCPAPPLSCLLK